jgi:hypothetical protein
MKLSEVPIISARYCWTLFSMRLTKVTNHQKWVSCLFPCCRAISNSCSKLFSMGSSHSSLIVRSQRILYSLAWIWSFSLKDSGSWYLCSTRPRIEHISVMVGRPALMQVGMNRCAVMQRCESSVRSRLPAKYWIV